MILNAAISERFSTGMDLHIRHGRIWEFQWKEEFVYKDKVQLREGWYFETKENIYKLLFSSTRYSPVVSIGRLSLGDAIWFPCGDIIRATKLVTYGCTVLFKEA